MTRLAIGAAVGLVFGMTLGAAFGIHGQEVEVDDAAVACSPGIGCTADPSLLDEVVSVAQEASVDPTALLGAANSTGLAPRQYLIAVGELAAPSPVSMVSSLACGWPICGPLGQRIYCVEAIESRHGAAMYNPTPVWNGEHAQGFLGFLPSTARRWGVTIGNRASEWSGAARMIASGAGGQFAGIAWGRC